MNVKNSPQISAPPRLIPSFLEGFNSVASHIRLILLPVLLDLIIWFAPRLHIKSLFEPLFSDISRLFLETASPEIQVALGNSQTVWSEILARLNLLGSLRTLPIGVPSLLAGRGVLENPLGSPAIFEITSFSSLLIAWLACVLVGLAAGSIFFGEVARISLNQEGKFTIRRFFRLFKYTVLFTVSAYVVIIVLTIPISLFVSVISLINPLLMQLAFIFLTLILIWLLMPLIFSPHGIYSYEQNVFTAAINSIRLVRYFLPSTGIFLLLALLINQGLDILWTFPPENSWMTVIGIFGHAFVVTGLIASSFVYYRGGIQWMNEKLQRFAGNPDLSKEQ